MNHAPPIAFDNEINRARDIIIRAMLARHKGESASFEFEFYQCLYRIEVDRGRLHLWSVPKKST